MGLWRNKALRGAIFLLGLEGPAVGVTWGVASGGWGESSGFVEELSGNALKGQEKKIRERNRAPIARNFISRYKFKSVGAASMVLE